MPPSVKRQKKNINIFKETGKCLSIGCNFVSAYPADSGIDTESNSKVDKHKTYF